MSETNNSQKKDPKSDYILMGDIRPVFRELPIRVSQALYDRSVLPDPSRQLSIFCTPQTEYYLLALARDYQPGETKLQEKSVDEILLKKDQEA